MAIPGAVACSRHTASGFRGYAFVANEEGQAIAAVDLTAFAVAKHIHIDGSPTSVIAHQTRPSVYALTPASGVIHEIETDRLTLLRKLSVAATALAMRLSSDGKAIYILCQDPKRLVRISLDTFRPEWHIDLPLIPVDFELGSRSDMAAISFGEAKAISFVDLATRICEKPIAQTGAIGSVRFQQDGRALIAANLEERMLSVFEVASRKLVVHLPLPVRPDNLCFNADGGQLFVTGEGMDAVAVVYPYHTPQVAGTFLAGRSPGAMAASKGPPEYLFITNPQSSEVTILNIQTQRVIAVMAAGTEPGYVAITPDDRYALVLNRKSGDVGVILVGVITANKYRSAAPLTMIPVGSKPVSAAIRRL